MPINSRVELTALQLKKLIYSEKNTGKMTNTAKTKADGSSIA
jgi:hypothetical protein